jgi:hypothetical protein
VIRNLKSETRILKLKARKLLPFVFLLSCFFFSMTATPARASCFNPAGNTGDTMYNADWHVPQYCNGGAWIIMGTPGVPLSIQNGLAGWWKLDDGSGTSAADSSGNGKTGTLVNAPTWTTGNINGALTFNGTNQQVSIPSLGLSSVFSFSFWVKSTYGTGSEMFSIGNFIYCEANYSAGDIAACSPDASTHVITAGGLMDGNWHHVAYVSTGAAATQLMYVDGTLQGTVTATPNLSGGSTATIASQNGSNYFHGTIDDVRVYNRALSAAEVAGLYNWGVVTGGGAVPALTGWWKFDEASGTSASDSSGNSNTGTLTASNASFVAGHINNAVSLTRVGNNTSGLVNIANPSNFNFEYNQSFTLAAWIYRNNNTGEDDLIQKEDPANNYRGYGLLFNAGSNSLYADLQFNNSGTHIEVYTNAAVSTGAWHHVVMTYDGSHLAAGVKLYVDGASQALTVNYDSLGTNTIQNADPLQIGGSGAGDGTTDNGCCTFNGKVDDARVYSGALTAAQVTQLYNGQALTGATTCANPSGNEGDLRYNGGSNHVMQFCGLSAWQRLGKVPGAGGTGCSNPAGSEGDTIYNKDYYALQYCDGTNWVVMGNRALTGLVGWWNLDEGSGTSAADSSGNGNTGTLNGGPTWTTSGKINGALTFNGTTQYVDVPDAASLQLAASFTVSAWVKLSALPAAGNYGAILQKDNTSGSTNYVLAIDNGSINTSSMGWTFDYNSTGTSDDRYATYLTTPNTGVWYHVAAVYDSVAQTETLYLNGVQVATNSVAGLPPEHDGGNDLSLGSRGAGSEFFPGTIDDARVYNRALGAGEIAHIYNGGP